MKYLTIILLLINCESPTSQKNNVICDYIPHSIANSAEFVKIYGEPDEIFIYPFCNTLTDCKFPYVVKRFEYHTNECGSFSVEFDQCDEINSWGVTPKNR